MKEAAIYFFAVSAWAVVGRVLLELGINPIALTIVWLVGFVWLTGYLMAGVSAADLLTRRWLQMIGGIAILSGAVVFLFS